MSQGKLNVLKEEMAIVNINILGISELKRKTTTTITIKISEEREAWHATVQLSSIQLLSHARLFATPWTTAHQASLSITKFWLELSQTHAH